jgi:signal transduction histidine kinase
MLNLFNNAREALVERGGDTRRIRITLSEEGPKYLLRFCDNGGGIDPAVLLNLFEPHVSTKIEGTGIGLYMTHLIITQKMRGTITAHNDGEGACFELRIPMANVSH